MTRHTISRKGSAPKSFPRSLHKNKDILQGIIFFLIDALIFTGAVLLWPLKLIKPFLHRSILQIKVIINKIRLLPSKSKKIAFNKTQKIFSENFRKIGKFIKKYQGKYRITVEKIRHKKIRLISFLKKIQNTYKKKLISLRQRIKKPTYKHKKIIRFTQWPVKRKLKYLISVSLVVSLLLIFFTTVFIWFSELPNPSLLKTRETPLTTKIYDRNNTLLYKIYVNQNRSFIRLNQLPKIIINATIATEDKNFYRHKGVDFGGIIRAAIFNLKNNGSKNINLQGGSSITQQLIKNTLLTPEKTISRKIKEIILAVWTEMIFTKSEILEMYFNQVPYGGTAWGIEAAAETYFGKKAGDLTPAESVLLAGLPAAPTLYSPFGMHPELSKKRQEDVLRRMVEDKYLSVDDANKIKEEKLQYIPQTVEIKAPHFVMFVKDNLVKKYGAKKVEQGGLSVVTTLDLNIQKMAEEEVTKEVDNLKYLSVGNGAALVGNPKSGDILAMVGSKDYFDQDNDGNVNVTLAQRQPGSSIKPVMYASAFEKGLTPSSVIDDSPVSYKLFGQSPYNPVNYDGKFHGKVTVRTALASSFNVPAVKILNSIGVHSMIEMGHRLGITTWGDESRFGLSLTLGGGEVTMLDMVQAYSVLANYGNKIDLDPIISVTDSNNQTIYTKEKNIQSKQVLSPIIAYQLTNILSDNNARAPAFGYNSMLRIDKKTVAVKTGTTNDKKDNWTIGYTQNYVVAVWVGNNDNSPMNPYLTSGVTGAAPIWNKIMTNLLTGKKDELFSLPQNLIAVKVCSYNGLLPCDNCPTITEYFIAGSEPTMHCVITPTPTPTPMP